MAISVPIYDRRVIEAAGPSYRQQLSGAPIAEAAGAVAGGLRSVAELAEQKMNEFDAAGLQAARAKAVRARLDAERRFDEQQGVNALAWSEHAPQAFADELGKIAEGLNGRQAVEWGRIRDDELAGFQGSIDGRVVKEHEALKEESHTALTTGLVEKASLLARDGPGNPELLKVADDMRKLVAGRAFDQGWTKAKAEAAGLAAMSELHAGALDAMLARQDLDGARGYLMANRPEISAKVATRIEGDINAKDVKQRSLDLAHFIGMMEGVRPSPFFYDKAKAYEHINNNPAIRGNVELYDATRARIDSDAADVEQARVLNDGEKLGRIEQDIRTGKGLDRQGDDFLHASDQGKGDAERMARSHGDAGSDKQNAIDRERWYDFLTLDPAVRRDLDVNAAFPDVTSERRAQMRAAQTALKGEGVNETTFRAQVNDTFLRRGVPKKLHNKYTGRLTGLYAEWKKDPDNVKREPTAKDVAGMFAKAHAEVSKERGWGLLPDAKGEWWEMQEEPVQQSEPAPVPAIPDAERQELIQSFRAHKGREPTPAEIEGAYRRANEVQGGGGVQQPVQPPARPQPKDEPAAPAPATEPATKPAGDAGGLTQAGAAIQTKLARAKQLMVDLPAAQIGATARATISRAEGLLSDIATALNTAPADRGFWKPGAVDQMKDELDATIAALTNPRKKS